MDADKPYKEAKCCGCGKYKPGKFVVDFNDKGERIGSICPDCQWKRAKEAVEKND